MCRFQGQPQVDASQLRVNDDQLDGQWDEEREEREPESRQVQRKRQSQSQSHSQAQSRAQSRPQSRRQSRPEAQNQAPNTVVENDVIDIDTVSKFALSLGPFIEALGLNESKHGHNHSHTHTHTHTHTLSHDHSNDSSHKQTANNNGTNSSNDINDTKQTPNGNGTSGSGSGSGSGSEGVGSNMKSIEENIMFPIREMIFKSVREPSQGMEGVEYVMTQLENVISSGASMDLLVSTIGHFLSVTLPPMWVDRMCRYMLERTRLIIFKFLNFKHYWELCYSTDDKRARLFVLQCALHRRFPLLATEGCATLARVPVFYGSKQSSLFRSYSQFHSHRSHSHSRHMASPHHTHHHMGHDMSRFGLSTNNERNRIAWELLQTGGSFKTIPSRQGMQNMQHPFGRLSMDVSTLEQEIARDKAKGRLPCVVIASETDNLEKIRQICDRNALWLHIDGGSSSLLLAAASSLPKATQIMIECADSISCQPFKWFVKQQGGDNRNSNRNRSRSRNNRNEGERDERGGGSEIESKMDDLNSFGGCSTTLTFIREDGNTLPASFGYTDCDFGRIFPLWHLLVTRSFGQMKTRVDHGLALVAYLKQQLCEYKSIFATAIGPGASVPHVLVFQVAPQANHLDLQSLRLDRNTFHELLLNGVRGEIAKRAHIGWKVYQDETCFVFEPLSLPISQLIEISHENISEFVQQIVVQINILKKCLELRSTFEEKLLNVCGSNNREIQCVDPMHVQSMVCLGAFRFVPLLFASDISCDAVTLLNKELQQALRTEWPKLYQIDNNDSENENVNENQENEKENVNENEEANVNGNVQEEEEDENENKYEISHNNNNNTTSEMTNDNMFRLSLDIFGNVCIVVNPDNEIFENAIMDKIVDLIVKLSNKLEYPNEVMVEMTMAIEKGIADAQKRVRQSAVNTDSTLELAKNIPVVGSVISWWSGANDNDKKAGFNFDLVSKTLSQQQQHIQQQQEQQQQNYESSNDDSQSESLQSL